MYNWTAYGQYVYMSLPLFSLHAVELQILKNLSAHMKKTTFSGTVWHLQNSLSFSKKVKEARTKNTSENKIFKSPQKEIKILRLYFFF